MTDAQQDRKRVRCPQKACGIVQFVNKSETCVRCKQSYAFKLAPEPASIQKPAAPMVFTFQYWIGISIAILRLRAGLTHSAMGKRLNAPRTWVTKIEQGRTTPRMSDTFPRLCEALGVTPSYVCRMTEFLVSGQ
jgi:DNA-binding XRE family transcriptional regulator